MAVEWVGRVGQEENRVFVLVRFQELCLERWMDLLMFASVGLWTAYPFAGSLLKLNVELGRRKKGERK